MALGSSVSGPTNTKAFGEGDTVDTEVEDESRGDMVYESNSVMGIGKRMVSRTNGQRQAFPAAQKTIHPEEIVRCFTSFQLIMAFLDTWIYLTCPWLIKRKVQVLMGPPDLRSIPRADRRSVSSPFRPSGLSQDQSPPYMLR